MASNRPSFPSLYDPHFVFNPFRLTPDAKYLDNAADVYVFMLYWTFILYAPLFVFTGICASLVLILDPLRRSPSQHQQPEDAQYRSKHIPKDLEATQRRCIAYGIAVLVLYGTAGLLLSVLSSTVVGFLIAGVYAVGRFRVSTWVPFIWALLQSVMAVTSMSSVVIDIV